MKIRCFDFRLISSMRRSISFLLKWTNVCLSLSQSKKDDDYILKKPVLKIHVRFHSNYNLKNEKKCTRPRLPHILATEKTHKFKNHTFPAKNSNLLLLTVRRADISNDFNIFFKKLCLNKLLGLSKIPLSSSV